MVGVKLPTGLYFGATAATGELAGIHPDLSNFQYCPAQKILPDTSEISPAKRDPQQTQPT